MTYRINAEQARHLADNYEPDYTFRSIEATSRQGYKSLKHTYRDKRQLEIVRAELLAAGFDVKPAPIYDFLSGEQSGVSETTLIISWSTVL